MLNIPYAKDPNILNSFVFDLNTIVRYRVVESFLFLGISLTINWLNPRSANIAISVVSESAELYFPKSASPRNLAKYITSMNAIRAVNVWAAPITPMFFAILWI